jgi:hypothetical protein
MNGVCVSKLIRGTALWWAIVAFMLGLAGCSPGGVGSGGTGLAEGFVSGFGSLVVDGVSYDDSQSSLVPESLDEQDASSEPRVGQRVRVRLRADQSIETVEVRPQLRGPVTRAPYRKGADEPWTIDVLGQPVRIFSERTADFPTTLLDSFASIQAIQAGENVEVHGAWVSGEAGSSAQLYAASIAALPRMPAYFKLSGLVAAADTVAVILNTEGPLRLARTSESTALTPGAEVEAWVLPEVWLSATAARPWGALATRRISLSAPATDSMGEFRLSAPLGTGQIDPVSGLARVNGMEVFVPADLRGRLGETARRVGLSLRRGADGGFTLQSIQSAEEADDRLGDQIRLKAVLRWPAQLTDTLTLRGTTVSGFGQAATQASGCRALEPGGLVFVDLRAARRAPGTRPLVSELRCSTTVPDQAVHEDSGEVLGIAPAEPGRSPGLLIARPNGMPPLRLDLPDPLTLAPNGLQALVGRRIGVDFQMRDGTAIARRLRNPP